VDQSGVLYLRGGTLWRRTADTATPGDTPPATLMFFHMGATKLWFWDGVQYWECSQGATSTPLSVTNGGTGASTALAALTNLSAMYEDQFVVQPNALTYAIDAADCRSSQWEFQDNAGTPGSPWQLTIPSAASLTGANVPAGHAFIIRNDTGQPMTIVHTSGGADWHLPEQSQGLYYFDGAEIQEVAQNYPQYYSGALSGDLTFTSLAQQVKAYFDLDTDATARTFTLMTNDGRHRGRLFTVRSNQDSGNTLTVKGSGGATADDTLLLRGETQILQMQAGGTVRVVPTRPYTRRVAITHDDGASYTVPQADALAFIIEVAGALTAGRQLVLPTMNHKMWFIYNGTTDGGGGPYAIEVKTSGGTGVSLANAEGAFFYGDGTNLYRMGAAAARA
jgi:hypothetical protein